MNNLLIPINQIKHGKIYPNQPFVSELTPLSSGFVVIVDHGDKPMTSDPRMLFKTQLFTKQLIHRGFPYAEQVDNALSTTEVSGLYIHVKEPMDSFNEKHFNEHSFVLNVRRGKYKKPVILHVNTNELTQCDIFKKNADVVFVRREIMGCIEVECVKNNLLH